MSEDLDSILNGEPAEIETPAAPEPVAEPEATPEPIAAEAQPRDERGRFAPKGETESASPAPVNEPPLDHAAVLGERRRRQEAEARNRELEEQLKRFQQPAAQPYQPQPQPQGFEFNEDLYWSNPNQFLGGFAQHIRESIMNEVRQSAPSLIQEHSLNRSEQLARARHEDYDQAADAFRNAAMVNPVLRDKLFAQPDPAEFAYQEGKRLIEMASYGSTNEYIEAEVARRLQAAQPAPPAPVIPVSLADAPASGPAADVPARPLSLDQIIGRR